MKINLKEILNEDPKKDENWITSALEEKKLTEAKKKQTPKPKHKPAVKAKDKGEPKDAIKVSGKEGSYFVVKTVTKSESKSVVKPNAKVESKNVVNTAAKSIPKAAVKAKLMASDNTVAKLGSKKTTAAPKVEPNEIVSPTPKVELKAVTPPTPKAEPKTTFNDTVESQFEPISDVSENYKDVTVELMPKAVLETIVENKDIDSEVLVSSSAENITKPIPEAKAAAITEQLSLIDVVPETEAITEDVHVINEEPALVSVSAAETIPATGEDPKSKIENKTEPELEAHTEAEHKPQAEPERKSLYKRYGWVAAIAASFAIILAAMFIYTSMIPKEVYATINGKSQVFTSTENTLEDLLEKENISYCSDDYISKPASTFIHDGMKFELKNATDFKVTADGKTTKHKTFAHTVQGALDDEGIKVSELDAVRPTLDTALEEDMNVVIQRADADNERSTIKLPVDVARKGEATSASEPSTSDSTKTDTAEKNSKKASSHEHNWVPVYSTGTRQVQYTKTVTGRKCTTCGARVFGKEVEHTIYHYNKSHIICDIIDAEYTETAYRTETYQYQSGSRCSICGATK